MPSLLLNLADELLLEILRLSIDLPPSATSILSRKQLTILSGNFVPGIHQLTKKLIIQNRAKTQKPSSAVLPVFLSCRRLYNLSQSLFLDQATFRLSSTPDLRYFVESIPEHQLKGVRNVRLALYSDDDYEHEHDTEVQGGGNTLAEEVIEEATDLMARLPSKLRRLQLEMSYHPWPFFSGRRETHRKLRWALDRFHGLEELDLNCYTHWLHIDMFTNMVAWRYSEFRLDGEGVPTPPLPKFQSLRHLRLEGCLTEMLSPRGFQEALSESQLPQLESLSLVGLLTDPDSDPMVFAPEALETMHPLREFQWIKYEGIRRTLGDPHPPLKKKHLDALKARHGQTLQRLKIDLGKRVWRGRRGRIGKWNMEIDQACLRSLVAELPVLQVGEVELVTERYE